MSSVTKFEALRERVPEKLLRSRQQGKNNITYISWYDACELLDERAPGWSMEIKQVGEIAGKVFVRVALTIDGVTRENIGSEDEDLKGYGDVFSNSVGMAIRRAAALFGPGRHLYDKSDKSRQGNSNLRSMPAQVGASVPYSNDAKAGTQQVSRIRELRSLHSITSPLDWNGLTVASADRLIKELEAR